MFRKLVKTLYAVPALLVSAGAAFAIPVAVDKVKSEGSVEILATSDTLFVYGINIITYLGGFMAGAAVLGGFGLMAWQAFSGDDDAAKVAQKWFPRVILAGLCGILLLAGPSIYTFTADLIGGTAPKGLGPSEFGNTKTK